MRSSREPKRTTKKTRKKETKTHLLHQIIMHKQRLALMIILLHRVSAEIAGRDAVGKTADADVAAWEGPAFAEGEHREPGDIKRQGEMSIGLKKGGYGSWRDGWPWVKLSHTPHATRHAPHTFLQHQKKKKAHLKTSLSPSLNMNQYRQSLSMYRLRSIASRLRRLSTTIWPASCSHSSRHWTPRMCLFDFVFALCVSKHDHRGGRLGSQEK